MTRIFSAMFFLFVLCAMLPACKLSDAEIEEMLGLNDPGEPADLTVDQLIMHMDAATDPEGKFKRIAVVSGSVGESVLQQAAECGVELLVTGEIGHQHYHVARELGLNVIAAGHYATETFGPKAVMAEVAKRFDVEVDFADFPTGM